MSFSSYSYITKLLLLRLTIKRRPSRDSTISEVSFEMKWFLVLSAVTVAHAMEKIYMKRSEIDDQESSASGYAYQLHSGGPLSYTAYPNALRGFNQLAYQPFALGTYKQELAPQFPLTADYKPQVLQAPFAPAPLNAYGLHGYGINGHPTYGYALNAALPQQLPQLSPSIIAAPLPIAIADSSKFAKGGGSSFADANQNSHGEKGSTGYKTVEQFDKGLQGKHDNQGQKEHFSKEGANKASHQDVAGHYAQKEEAAKGNQGSSFHQANKHKKGSKTTGFHRVHHKDEYKKDHSFYDESDANGHFNKYGDYNAHHSGEKGGFKKGGHEDKAYQAAEHGAKGYLDNGKYVDEDSGFKGAEGKQQHFKDFQEYAKKGGEQEGKEYGFAKKDILQAQQ